MESIRDRILELTTKVGPKKSICPSEVARALWPDQWQERMEDVRAIARELHLEGRIFITQRGKPVEDLDFRGPIRLRIREP